MNDEKLHQLLHAWKVEPDLTPSFHRDVWERIERTEPPASALTGWLANFLTWLARPVPAVAACVLTLAGGLLMGGLAGGKPADPKPAAYVYSIDPLTQLASR